ncbi:hypothetical protein GcM1_c15805o18 [Golovinomyces cichoracearum]|uniref:Uncharacterized protein n=1 Tax=Golovinomyces cichoracearum TaxID=62708 RepID=A0A420IS21_9PEZI|nr:hypothetical protein GcM1_c15805o18 [Golovinomyces cichoracearum]
MCLITPLWSTSLLSHIILSYLFFPSTCDNSQKKIKCLTLHHSFGQCVSCGSSSGF